MTNELLTNESNIGTRTISTLFPTLHRHHLTTQKDDTENYHKRKKLPFLSLELNLLIFNHLKERSSHFKNF